jgi:hypothetical protein
MPFTQGIQTINILTANLSTNTDIVPNDITGFTFNLGAGKRLEWELRGVVTTGATGGFRLVANSTVAATTYNAEWQIVDETTPATFQDAQIAQADFTNASAVATNYNLIARGCIVAAAATVFSIQFAQNNSTANNITMNAGMTLKLIQF